MIGVDIPIPNRSDRTTDSSQHSAASSASRIMHRYRSFASAGASDPGRDPSPGATGHLDPKQI